MGHLEHCLSLTSTQGFWTNDAPDEALKMASPLPNRDQQCQGQFAPTPLQVKDPLLQHCTVPQLPRARHGGHQHSEQAFSLNKKKGHGGD